MKSVASKGDKPFVVLNGAAAGGGMSFLSKNHLIINALSQVPEIEVLVLRDPNNEFLPIKQQLSKQQLGHLSDKLLILTASDK